MHMYIFEFNYSKCVCAPYTPQKEDSIMEMAFQVAINAPVDKVWKVVAHDFHKADEWVSTINHSRVRPEAGPAPGLAPLETAGRACDTTLGGFKETIVHYDEQHHRFGYQAEGEKMPFFVKKMVNNWTVKPRGPHRSLVDMKLDIELMPVIGTLMQPMMKLQLSKVLREATEELKHFVETGEPHPRKVAAMKKLQAK